MEEWRRLQETVIAFFSSWLAICVTPAITRKSYFQAHSRVTQWCENTPEKTKAILTVLFVQYVKNNFGQAFPNDSRECYGIVVCSYLTQYQEKELEKTCNWIMEHTGISCRLCLETEEY